MKTFETEKHNIPEGATHYENETSISHFAWFKLSGDDLLCMPITNPDMWLPCSLEFCKDSITPIPQTKEVDWVNGERCISSSGYEFTFIGKCISNGFDCILLSEQGIPTLGFIKELSKPETEAERVERERLEAVEEMFTYWSDDKGDFVAGDDDDRWVKELLFALHDAGYKRDKL